MTDRVLSQWPTWRDKAILELRMKGVPGEEIGEILTEVETHLQESGESPEDAFGDPVAYARDRMESVNMVTKDGANMITGAIGGALGGFVLAHSAWRLGAGEPMLGNMPAWIGVLLGAALLAWVFHRIGLDLITDPRTGRPVDSGPSTWIMLIVWFGGSALILAFAGWFFAR